MIHVNLYGYVVTFGEVSGDVGVAQSFWRHILQMNRAIDLPRLLSIDKFYSTPDQHSFEVQARPRHVNHHRRAALARRFRYLCVWLDVGMQMSLPTRKNHMGKTWMLSSWSSVARFAISVIERILSISAELRTGGLSDAASEERLVISFSSFFSCINIPDHIHNLRNRYGCYFSFVSTGLLIGGNDIFSLFANLVRFISLITPFLS
jgi:hypothetical protein